jgi:hypothetical protein
MTKRVITLRPKAPWYNDQISAAKRLRRQSERRWRKTHLEVDRQYYKQQRESVNTLIM